MFEQTSLINLFSISQRNGLTKPKRLRGKGIKMVNMGELFSERRIKNLSMDRVPCSEKELLANKLEKGDLLFARQSLTLEGAGKSSIFLQDSEDVVFESHIIRCRFDKRKANPLYYFYFFESEFGKKRIGSIVEQVAAAGIRGSDLVKLPVFKPNISDQNAIANILNNLDEKIEQNKKTSQILEETAKAIFKSWFVDFDPVKAKATGTSLGISKKISNLFPDTFYESKLGKIPKGWEIHKIGEIFNTVIGGTPSRKDDRFWDGANGWINSGAINKFPLIEPSEYISDAAVKKSSTKYSKKKSTLIALVTAMNSGLITFSEIDVFINQSVVAIQPNDIIFPEYVYLYTKFNYKRLYREQSGGAQQHINKNIVNNFEILKPHDEILEACKDTFKNIFEKIAVNTKQNLILSNLRDTLLPKLISGQLKVSNINHIIEKKVI